MKIIFSAILLLCFNMLSNSQSQYYVDQQNGSNTNNGTSTSTAFQSINSAKNLASPGDTIYIMGEYKNPSFNPNYSYTNEHDPHLWHAENSIRINNLHGSASNYITIKAYNENTILKGDGANIFRISNSSYLRIEGFEIEGEVPNIPLSTANALQFVYIRANEVANILDPTAAEIQYRDKDCVSNCTPNAIVVGETYRNLNGIDIARPSYIDTRGLYLSNVNHIDIINNKIHDMPGGGLRVSDCEDINIIGNEIYACSRKSYSGTHALVVTRATSSRTTNDYRIKILRNKIHHNYNEQYSWAPTKNIITPHIDEGKGISLQRNETTYNNDNAINVNWEHGRILVANNICYYNGFSGVHSNDGNRIDIIYNTCYFNSYTKSITEGITANNGGNIGISAQGGSDVKIINNISVIDSGLSKSAIASNISSADGLVVRNNIIYGTTRNGVTGTINEDADIVAVQVDTQITDPLFTDPVNFDFSLQQNSPAIGAATVNAEVTNDYYNKDRGTDPDTGAIEYSSTLHIDDYNSNKVFLFPNPVDNILTVKGVTFKLSDIKIFNFLGQEFTNFRIINNGIDLSDLSKGSYIVKVKKHSEIIFKE
ncbi:T9SS type A sorting domain-containing protein [Tenacibaculum amylolyticum]|uniref:T9SS type A sorting domain-containing protein n=1 Tax=Tenacibaculum amylolyticum TaxID=104269 RepID=UPI003894E69C